MKNMFYACMLIFLVFGLGGEDRVCAQEQDAAPQRIYFDGKVVALSPDEISVGEMIPVPCAQEPCPEEMREVRRIFLTPQTRFWDMEGVQDIHVGSYVVVDYVYRNGRREATGVLDQMLDNVIEVEVPRLVWFSFSEAEVGTFAEAEEYCAAKGARLPTVDEFLAKFAESSADGFDLRYFYLGRGEMSPNVYRYLLVDMSLGRVLNPNDTMMHCSIGDGVRKCEPDPFWWKGKVKAQCVGTRYDTEIEIPPGF